MDESLKRLDSAEYDRLSAEQTKLLIFRPLVTHAIGETTGHYAFHAQPVTDFVIVEELGHRLLRALKSAKKT
jgi:hypothetical protein